MTIKKALTNLNEGLKNQERNIPIDFNKFLELSTEHPQLAFRNIFQLFYDMIHYYVPETKKESGKDLMGFTKHDLSKLLTEDVDTPFYPGKLFSNTLMDLVGSFKKRQQNNRIILFEGPPGSGKSMFLKNLFYKFEEFSKIPEGTIYETVWRFDIKKLGGFSKHKDSEIEDKLNHKSDNVELPNDYFDVPCPNHDHPILQIPKKNRRQFLEDLIMDEKFKNELFNKREYAWVFKQNPCTICTSIYKELVKRLGVPEEIFNMIYAQKYQFNRMMGRGITVFGPGDKLQNKPDTNQTLQFMINNLLKDSNAVKYVFSDFAKTNNGIFAIMDIKNENRKRLSDLHGIISDEIHKVGGLEECINSLFLGLVNPEDKKKYEESKTLRDRIILKKLPLILDYNDEVKTYKDKFKDVKDISCYFLPGVLENFSKTIISSRLNPESKALSEWITNPSEYKKHLDDQLLLLKMDLYAIDSIPKWISEEDRKKFTQEKIGKKLRKEFQLEGLSGISGRESLEFFNEFFRKYAKPNELITMKTLNSFFQENEEFVNKKIPEKFLESLTNMYNFNVLQEIKEATYHYDKKQISRNIQNYLYCINYDPNTVETCKYTGDTIEITKEYFKDMETMFIGEGTEKDTKSFRNSTQREYALKTLSEIKEGWEITETELYKSLLEKYKHNLKENVLDSLIKNEKFRTAIQDYETESFKIYDNKLQRNIPRIIKNLQEKFGYTKEGAKQVCLYVLDNDIALNFNS